MTYLNELTAVIGAAIMLLVARGYGPNLAFRGNTAAHHIRICGVVMWLLSFVRMVWWDLVRPLLGKLGVMAEAVYPVLGEYLNTGFNITVLVAGYFALKALLLSIPESHRKYYNLLTCVFYPRKSLIKDLGSGK